MADLARLVVRLEAESAQLTRQLNRSNRELERFRRGARRSLEGFSNAAKAAFGAITVGALVNATRNAVDFADSIDKAAQRAGVSAEALQEFRFAADQLGITNQQLDDGLRRLNRRLGEFANSGGGPAKAALEQLNIAVRDTSGSLRPTEDILTDLVSAFESVETPAQQAALAAQLFGDDAGPQLALLLGQGIEGVNALRETARQTGQILSSEMVANAVAAEDAIGRLSFTFTNTANTILLQLAPVLEDTANFLADNLPSAIQATLNGLQDLRELGVGAASGVNRFLASVAEGFESLALSVGAEDVAQSFRNVRQGYLDTAEDLEDLKLAYEETADSANQFSKSVGTRAPLQPISTPTVQGIGTADLAARKREQEQAARSQEAFNRELQSTIETLDPIVRLSNDYVSTFNVLHTALEQGQISQQLYNRLLGEAREEFERSAGALDDETQALIALKDATLAAVDPNREIVAELEKLDKLLTALQDDELSLQITGGADVEAIIAAVQERMFELQEGLEQIDETGEESFGQLSEYATQAARTIQSTLADFLYDPFQDGLDGMLAGFVDFVRRAAAEAAAAQLLEKLFGSAGSTTGGIFGSGGIEGVLGNLLTGFFAGGTDFAPGGLAVVGERGPEVVNLPRGSTVTPLNEARSGSIMVNVNVAANATEETRRSAGQIGRDIAARLNRDLRRNG